MNRRSVSQKNRRAFDRSIKAHALKIAADLIMSEHAAEALYVEYGTEDHNPDRDRVMHQLIHLATRLREEAETLESQN